MKRLDNRSRMKREFHVRFCESLKGKYFGLLDFAVAKVPPLFVSSDTGVMFQKHTNGEFHENYDLQSTWRSL